MPYAEIAGVVAATGGIAVTIGATVVIAVILVPVAAIGTILSIPGSIISSAITLVGLVVGGVVVGVGVLAVGAVAAVATVVGVPVVGGVVLLAGGVGGGGYLYKKRRDRKKLEKEELKALLQKQYEEEQSDLGQSSLMAGGFLPPVKTPDEIGATKPLSTEKVAFTLRWDSIKIERELDAKTAHTVKEGLIASEDFLGWSVDLYALCFDAYGNLVETVRGEVEGPRAFLNNSITHSGSDEYGGPPGREKAFGENESIIIDLPQVPDNVERIIIATCIPKPEAIVVNCYVQCVQLQNFLEVSESDMAQLKAIAESAPATSAPAVGGATSSGDVVAVDGAESEDGSTEGNEGGAEGGNDALVARYILGGSECGLCDAYLMGRCERDGNQWVYVPQRKAIQASSLQELVPLVRDTIPRDVLTLDAGWSIGIKSPEGAKCTAYFFDRFGFPVEQHELSSTSPFRYSNRAQHSAARVFLVLSGGRSSRAGTVVEIAADNTDLGASTEVMRLTPKGPSSEDAGEEMPPLLLCVLSCQGFGKAYPFPSLKRGSWKVMELQENLPLGHSESECEALQEDRLPSTPTTLSITIKTGTELAPKDLTGRSDPYVRVNFDNEGEDSRHGGKKTSVKKFTLEPTWNETIEFELGKNWRTEMQEIHFHVLDKDLTSKDDLMGHASVSLDAVRLPFDGPLRLWAKHDHENEKVSGSISVAIAVK
eukprot:TRINITY_DN1282_c0_g1_i1.p1 TRINITY_DN1282_c0_g1~~TRINITY_DN1282_c0_g1_i1.p1  ORF type:complete len:709 (-),score=181.31 TRINITY_DN1282_c0_g1_i1:158-2284(-)